MAAPTAQKKTLGGSSRFRIRTPHRPISPLTHVYWGLSRLSPRLVDWLMREGWRRRGKVGV